MDQNKQNSFVLYFDYSKHISLLSDQEAGQLFKALFKFGEHGTIPDFSGSLLMCFSFISSQMLRDKEKYIDICEKRAEAGRKGGKQKQANLASANFVKQKQANLADNDTGNDNVNDTDTEKKNNMVNDVDRICTLLNQAKAKARSRGRLKAKGAEWHIEEILNAGVSMDTIKAAAENAAQSGKNINWYSFKAMLINSEKGGIS